MCNRTEREREREREREGEEKAIGLVWIVNLDL